MTTPAEIKLVLSLAIKPGSSGYKIHNAGYKAFGLDYLYLPRKFEGEISQALEAIRALQIKGASLTMPYKVAAIEHLDELSQEASEIGAVNTVVNVGGKLKGYNTDAPAAKMLIEKYLPSDKSLVILGAGGMAHAFAYAAKELNIKTFISARDEERAKYLVEKFQLETIIWGDWQNIKDMILCNATPIGMAGDETGSLPEDVINSLAGVFDAVAGPANTKLVKTAKSCSLPVVSGDMLALEQACLQFKLYTGIDAPRDVMREAMYG
jgi:shikimate dehydrogenase